MVRKQLSRQWVLGLGALSLVALVVAYSAVSAAQHQANPTDTTIPSLLTMGEGLWRAAVEKDWLMVDTLASGYRLGLGLGISIVLSVLTGVLMGSFHAVESLLLPPLAILAKVVPTAALAVFFALVGTDTELFVTMIVFGVSPSLTLSVHLAAKAIPVELIDKAYTLGASHAEVVWGVIFPAILPQVIDAMRLAIGPAMVYLIAAELLVSSEGFGYRIRILSRRLDMDVVYPYIALLAASGFGMDTGLRLARRWLCPWYVEG